MEVLAQIEQARDAGLCVDVDGAELVIRGPRRLAGLAQRLIERKTDVLTALEVAKTAAQVRHVPVSRDLSFSRATSPRLIGNGFVPIPPTIPPETIRAAPVVLCAACNTVRVVPELRTLTGGRCYGCWEMVGVNSGTRKVNES